MKKISADLFTIYSDLFIENKAGLLPAGIIQDPNVENHWVYWAIPANFELQRDSFIFAGLRSVPKNILATYSQFIKNELDGNQYDFKHFGKFMFLLSKNNLDFCYD